MPPAETPQGWIKVQGLCRISAHAHVARGGANPHPFTCLGGWVVSAFKANPLSGCLCDAPEYFPEKPWVRVRVSHRTYFRQVSLSQTSLLALHNRADTLCQHLPSHPTSSHFHMLQKFHRCALGRTTHGLPRRLRAEAWRTLLDLCQMWAEVGCRGLLGEACCCWPGTGPARM